MKAVVCRARLKSSPKPVVLGTDFAGTVESVGKNVGQFQAGDAVFGGMRGAFAEYICIRESGAVVSKPANISFEQAAAVPVAAITARAGWSVGGSACLRLAGARSFRKRARRRMG